MSRSNVQSSQGVTLVGGGALGTGDLDEALALAPGLVAADGGADACLAAGRRPEAVIGDMDSVSDAARAALGETSFIEVAEQDSTDFDKALSLIEAPFVLAVGFAGARLDHTLAVFSGLVRRPEVPPVIVIGPEDMVFAAPRRLAFDVGPDVRVSLFPLRPVTGRSRGLAWPIEGLVLEPAGRIGTSNETTGPVELDFDAPGCLVLMPRGVLRPLLSALRGPGGARAR